MGKEVFRNSKRANYYGELAEYDSQKAFREVRLEIIKAQEALRRSLPRGKINICLYLVTITGEDSLRFDDEYCYVISEKLGVPRDKLGGNFYYGLGYYVDLLENEALLYA